MSEDDYNNKSNSANDARLNELMKKSSKASSSRRSGAGGSREGGTVSSGTSGGGSASANNRSSRHRPPRDDRSQASSTDTPRRISSRASSEDKSIASHSSSKSAEKAEKPEKAEKTASSRDPRDHRDHQSGSGGGGKSSSTRRSRRDSKDLVVDNGGDGDAVFDFERSASMDSLPPDAGDLADTVTFPTNNTQTSPIVKPPVPDSLTPPRIHLGDAHTIWIQEKPMKPPPKANPLTGRLIFVVPSNTADGSMPTIVEWNAHTQSPVCSTPILSPELLIKLQQKYPTVIATVLKVESVLQLAVGVHEAHGYTRARVAALMKVQVQDYQWRRDVLTIIAIYQWNYGSGATTAPTTCPLQSVLVPPAGGDFTYQAESLLMAESCVFLAGHSTQKGPCVFISQPTVKETWSANFVERTGRITCMAVVHASIHPKEKPQKITNVDAQQQRLPYLAIALADGSLSVWTYEAAMKSLPTNKRTNTPSTEASVARRLLYALCRLETDSLQKVPATDWESNTTMDATVAPVTVGYCTQLEWITPCPTAQNQLLFLSAAFQGGLAIYHVGLPKLLDATTKKYAFPKPPSEKTQLSQTPSLAPIAAICWPQAYKESHIAMVDLGPHMPTPSVVVLLIQDKDSKTAATSNKNKMVLVSYDCPIFGIATSQSRLRVWDSKELNDNPKGLLPGTSSTGVLYHTDRSLQVVELALLQQARRWTLNRGGLGSIPTGLTTNGTVYASDCDNSRGNPHKDGVWHIFSTMHVERRKGHDRLEWNVPSRRHWLVETRIGDCKEATAVALPGPVDDVVMGGTTTKVVCELGGGVGGPIGKLFPFHLCRREGMAAVVFRSLSNVSSYIGIIVQDASDKAASIAQVVEGRDAAFVSDTQLVILSQNGGLVNLWERSNADGSWGVSDASYRPIVGVNESSAHDYIHCERIFSTTFQDGVSLLAVAYHASTNKSCIVAGNLVPSVNIDLQDMLPRLHEAVCWLNPNEVVCSVLSLPSEQEIRGGIVVSSSHRLMILDPATLHILSSVTVQVPPTSLVPIGSFSIAYASHDDYKIRYLSGVPESFGACGLVASLPAPQHDYNPYWILAIRPDRLVYSCIHMGSRLVERGQDSNVFLMPTAITRPALLLEPMIANAIATGREQTANQPFLRTIIEKFGRKVATTTHGEGEGIGNHGAGITPRVFELLDFYNLQAAASWLLTGTPRFNRSANSRLLPAWMPVSAKVMGAIDSDTNLHAIANGDQYFSEYIKSPDHNMTATLPRPSDPSAAWCSTFAQEYLRRGKALDAFTMLDIAGTEASDTMLLQLSLAMHVDSSKDVSPILNSLFYTDSQMGKTTSVSSVASLAALAAELRRTRGVADENFIKDWMRPLAPSIQRGRKLGRNRPRIMGESAFQVIGKSEPLQDRLFSTEIHESKLVWNEGPNREKENLLMLDNFQEWLGRRRPLILGKEGVKSAEDRGASTLADILAQPDEDSFGNGEADDDLEVGWVDGVGEGQKDEDKLSAYFRFSEGDDEDCSWREEGFADLSKFEARAFLVGCSDTAALAESSSSVDAGDPGKVKSIFDLVFSTSGVGKADALAISASRGGSLDVGMMHGPEQTARQKLALEFWFWVPENIPSEIILARRTFGSSADDLDAVCLARNKSSSLWELVFLTTGEIEFRTVSGDIISSSVKPTGDEDDDGPRSTLSFGRWNHVCVTMKQQSIMASKVLILVKGNIVCEKVLDFKPPKIEEDDFAGTSGLDAILEKSHLVFGLDHPVSFRLTELRVWATDRDEADVRTMMTEYLEAAEMKRKFRVKIKKKGDGPGIKRITGAPSLLTPQGTLALPKPGALTPPKIGAFTPPKGTILPPKIGLTPPREERVTRKRQLATPKGLDEVEKVSPTEDAGFGGFQQDQVSSPLFGEDVVGDFGTTPISAPTSFESGFGDDGAFQAGARMTFESGDEGYDDEIEISPLWDSAIPLSEQVRSSAASALIRGPPATRHFGGNRGGLPDYREMDRLGVGAISICGSEKTIVWRDDQVPPGLTYPIGASGAIVSDQMDEDGSEFLCCFLAKEKRMVVFELSTRTVVVELQMTTKLNYWRFLPPEAGEDTLCFMLITPVGGFHWQALDESPRPRQVWRRGPELQSKKIVSYEEGGTNGMDGPDIISRVGMILVTNSAAGGRLEAWVVPICGDSQAVCASDEVVGGCLCQPPDVGFEPWMPLLLFVVESDDGDLVVCVSAVTATSDVSIGLTEVMTDALIEMAPYRHKDYEPPTLAMGNWPEVLCCSLGSTIVIIVRRKGLVVAYELADTGLELIAQEHVGHFVVDAVMRYSAVEGGAEIVLLMSDSESRRDGRVGTFCFRTTA